MHHTSPGKHFYRPLIRLLTWGAAVLIVGALVGSTLIVLQKNYQLFSSVPKGTATPILSTATSVIPAQTACPPANTGRPAVLPSLAMGHRQALLYTAATSNPGEPPDTTRLYRYDVTTGTKKIVQTFSHESVLDTQISADGQWLLFLTQVTETAPTKLQLVRMDGQERQTLYCGSISRVRWSPDQKLVSFYGTDKDNGLYVLDLQLGHVQRVLDLPLHPFYDVVTWLDATHLYLHSLGVDAPSHDILLLDLGKGVDQRPGRLRTVFETSDPSGDLYAFVDFDRSADGKALFLSIYSRYKGSSSGSTAPSSIEVMSPTGGNVHPLFTSATLAIRALRVIDSHRLCLLVANEGDTNQDGLWAINVDGTALTRLNSFGKGTNALFNDITQSPWSNFSRDVSLYGIWTTTSHGATETSALLIGSLRGGKPTLIQSADAAQTELAIVGWTTV